jgi:hypothetical protein
VESIKAMADAVGIEHVGIGTDTDLLSSREGQGTNKAYRDRRNSSRRGPGLPISTGNLWAHGLDMMVAT